MTFQEELREIASGAEIALTDAHLAAFERYYELLIDWNRRMNLTAITEPREVIIKHFLDSLLPQQHLSLPNSARIIDVGTGAGFPGIPIKLMRPDVQVTLLDSLQKRTVFLGELCDALGIDCEIIHGRAEEFSHASQHRERYDVAYSRAVANLPALCEYCLPFVKTGGIFAALKGPGAGAELALAGDAIRLLGGEVAGLVEYELPDYSQRSLVMIKKISQTPPKYPRKQTKITKNPL